MKDQENNPQKGNQNYPDKSQRILKEIQQIKIPRLKKKPQTSGNQEWNKGSETAKKGNQNWDDDNERNPNTQAKPGVTPSQTPIGTNPQKNNPTVSLVRNQKADQLLQELQTLILAPP